MSTKTTFKRIALVTVAALGFGVLTSVAPASAANSVMSLGNTSLTIVGDGVTNLGFTSVNITSSAGDNSAITNTESLTATVIAWPSTETSSAVNDILFTIETRSAINTFGAATNAASTSPANNPGSAWIGNNSNGAGASAASAANPTDLGAYWFGIRTRAGSNAMDKGAYTIRFRLTNSSGFITSANMTVNFVTSAADSGAAITIATAGTFTSGESTTMTALKSVTATLTNGVAGGKIQVASSTTAIGVPALSVATWAGSTAAIVDSTAEWQATDTGTQVTSTAVAGDFYSETTSDSATAWTSAQDGVYGIVSAVGTGLSLTNLSVSPFFRVTYGATAATKAITVLNAASQTATPSVVFSGVGALTATTPFTLPLTTKTATFTVSGATAGAAYQYKVEWTSTGTGDQTPLDATWTTVYASADGKITAPLTNGNPVNGATATVSFTGFTSSVADQVITWKKSSATNISVDNGGAYVALKSTTVFTATITDAFGAPVAGVVLQPAFGATTNANYSATLATVTTDASGKASYTITDAAAVAAGKDTIGWTAVDGTSLTGTASATITYAAAAPAPTTLTGYYSADPTTADASTVTAVPAGGIYVDGSSTKFPIQKARNTAIANAAAASVDQLKVRISTGVTGAKVVATANGGAYVLVSGFQAKTQTLYSGTTGYTAGFVLGSNTTGANTVTFTSGTVTTTVSFWVGNTANDARFVTLTQAAAAGPVVATVTDRYGNGVASAQVQISTSAGTLGNGQMTTVYNTDLSGKISVLPTGADSAVITAIATNTSAQHADLAGYAGTAAVNADLKAGNSTATLSVTPVASASDVAQAATDAAAEATDAANAATDAANAAAEAADAATAAAQDAADAVAALSAQVATLISGLKAQLTALTNLVIKIQKKVKA